MYSSNRIYTNYKFIFVYLFLCLQILNVRSSKPFELIYHKNIVQDVYDVTTIYRVKNLTSSHATNVSFMDDTFFTTYNEKYSIEIHSRTNAIGVPLQRNDRFLHKDNYLRINADELQYGIQEKLFQKANINNISFDPNVWKKQKIQLNGHNCQSDGYDVSNIKEYAANSYFIYKPFSHDDLFKCFTALEYRYDKYFSQNWKNKNVYSTFFELDWTPDEEQSCLTITYVHRLRSRIAVMLDISKGNVSEFSAKLEKNDDVTTMRITNIDLKKSETYKLKLQMKSDMYYYYKNDLKYLGIYFGLLQISQCPSYNEEEVREVDTKISPSAFKILATDENVEEPSNSTRKDKEECLNGGHISSSSMACVCPPGFIGKLCETACGPNFYGADCSGVCSMHQTEMCRGMFMCTAYGCTCPPGLTGPLCQKDCNTGTYGANCQQKCSSSCLNNECNQYTGACLLGCSPGYVSPNCEKKYPHINKPFEHISSTNDSITIKVNLQFDNDPNVDETKKLMYYQILYKPQNKDNYTVSELKLITENIKETTEVLSDLKSGIVYHVGVRLIFQDGNFNDGGIEYTDIRTPCSEQPKITDYNVTLESEEEKVLVKWNPIITRPSECDVKRYHLTLALNQSQNRISGVQEIESSSNNSHLIKDLWPGFKYSVTLTPYTELGPLTPSTHTISTLTKEKDVEVKDIVVTTNDTIKLSWKLMSTYQHGKVVNETLETIVRYKINRILSCSMDERPQEEWKTEKVNETTYEIKDALPNSQYRIQVITANDKVDKVPEKNTVYTLTPATNPTTEPVADMTHPIIRSNRTATIHWKLDPNNCAKMNGIFSTFYVELKETLLEVLRTKETKENFISFDKLKPNTTYETKVFIKTNIGFNSGHYYANNFTTLP